MADGVTGTRVTFKPDPEMFRDTTVYDFDTLEKRLREESFLNAGVKITLTDERELYTPVLEDGKEGEPTYRTEVMCYEGGIKSFVTYLGEKRDLEVLHPTSSISRDRPTGAWQRSLCSIIPATMSCC